MKKFFSDNVSSVCRFFLWLCVALFFLCNVWQRFPDLMNGFMTRVYSDDAIFGVFVGVMWISILQFIWYGLELICAAICVLVKKYIRRSK